MAVKYAGVDMSYCQPTNCIDYKALKQAKIKGYTVKFAMLRFSYGMSRDNVFEAHYNGCKEAGIYVGAYHWLRAQNTSQARTEARWLIEQLNPYSFEYPIALDFEDEDLFALNLSKAKYTAIVTTFMQELERAGYYAILYTNPDTLKNRLESRVLDMYDLWLAHWTDVPAQYGQKMWQYAALGNATDVAKGWATDIGSVDGVRCPIDVNWCYVGYAKKIRELGKNGQKVAKRYRLTAYKTVSESAIESTANQLKALGYTVKKTEINS